MTRVAAVDIGTNSTRLLVADVDGPGRDAKLVTVERRTQITRLGPGRRPRPHAASRRDRAHARGAARVPGRDRRARRRARAGDRDERGARRGEPRRPLRSRPSRCSASGPSCSRATRRRGSSSSARPRAWPSPSPYLVVDVGGGSTEFIVGTDEPGGLMLDRHRLRAAHRAVPALRSADGRGAEPGGVGRARPPRRRRPRGPRRLRRADAHRHRRHGVDAGRDRARRRRRRAAIASTTSALTRAAAEEVFRTLATEPIEQRRHNPGPRTGPGRRDRRRRDRRRQRHAALGFRRAARLRGRHPRRPRPGLGLTARTPRFTRAVELPRQLVWMSWFSDRR